MTKNNDISRRNVIVGASTVMGAAILPSAAVAQNDQASVDAFYRGQKYTYCDAKVLAHFWGTDEWSAKIGAGEMLLQRQERDLKDKLRSAASRWSQDCKSCGFEDMDNPVYSYDDAAALAAFWVGGRTPYHAKMKIVLNVEGGGNHWVVSELAKAR